MSRNRDIPILLKQVLSKPWFSLCLQSQTGSVPGEQGKTLIMQEIKEGRVFLMTPSLCRITDQVWERDNM